MSEISGGCGALAHSSASARSDTGKARRLFPSHLFGIVWGSKAADIRAATPVESLERDSEAARRLPLAGTASQRHSADPVAADQDGGAQRALKDAADSEAGLLRAACCLSALFPLRCLLRLSETAPLCCFAGEPEGEARAR